MELTDTEIIKRILVGEQAMFAQLVQRYQQYVFTLVYRFTDNREDAEEISQDVFVKAYRSLADFRGKPNSAPGFIPSSVQAASHFYGRNDWMSPRLTTKGPSFKWKARSQGSPPMPSNKNLSMPWSMPPSDCLVPTITRSSPSFIRGNRHWKRSAGSWAWTQIR